MAATIGFFTRVELTRGNILGRTQGSSRPTMTPERLHDLECKACPLNHARNLHPKMEPTGARGATVYVLSEAPGKVEDHSGRHLSSEGGKFLRKLLGPFAKDLRAGSVIRDRTPSGRKASETEVECCRPSVAKDIERTAPSAVIAIDRAARWFGAKEGGRLWRGRRFPYRIGKAAFWVYPVDDPARVLRVRNIPRSAGPEEFALFKKDVRRVIRDLAKGIAPDPWDEARFSEGLEVFRGRPGELETIRKRLKEFAKESVAAHDWECSRLRPWFPGWKPLAFGLSIGRRTISIGIDHPETQWSSQERVELKRLLGEYLLENPHQRVSAHNLSFDLEVNVFLWGPKIARAKTWDCTMAQAYILDERPGGLSLGFRTQELFGVSVKTFDSLNMKALEHEPLDRLLHYNGIDSRAGYETEKRQRRLLKETR